MGTGRGGRLRPTVGDFLDEGVGCEDLAGRQVGEIKEIKDGELEREFRLLFAEIGDGNEYRRAVFWRFRS